MFDRIKGQEKAVRTIVNLIRQGRFPHALLFYGPQGVGKFTLAKLIARYFFCPAQDESVRGEDGCPVCRQVDQEVHYDLLIARKEKYTDARKEEKESKEIKVDQIRNLIRKTGFKPLEGKYKFFIVDGAEAMNDISENAFLKTLEEPRPGNHIILIAHNIASVLPTVLSRCVKIGFEPLKEELVRQILTEEYGASGELSSVLASLSSGSISRAGLLLENRTYQVLIEQLDLLIAFLPGADTDLGKLNRAVETAVSLPPLHAEALLELFLIFFHESFLFSRGYAASEGIFKKHLNLENISVQCYNRITDEIIRARHWLSDSNINARLLFSDLMVGLKEKLCIRSQE